MPDVGAVAVVAGGELVLAIGHYVDDIAAAQGRPSLVGYGLKVLSGRSLGETVVLEAGAAFTQIVVGAGGNTVYLLTAEDPPRLVAFDVPSASVAAEWSLPSTGAYLLQPGR